MSNFFGGSSCTWIIILLIILVLFQDNDSDCGCGCGCNGNMGSNDSICGGCGMLYALRPSGLLIITLIAAAC